MPDLPFGDRPRCRGSEERPPALHIRQRYRGEVGHYVPGITERKTVTGQRLYRLAALPKVETHALTLRLPPGVSGYAFTFG